jgi:hypothetical protein
LWERAKGCFCSAATTRDATADPRDGALHVAANNFVYGATVQRSGDGGKTWERAEQLAMPKGHDPLKRMWHTPLRADSEVRVAAAIAGG